MEFGLNTKVIIGEGRHRELGKYLAGWKTALIVCGSNVRAAGIATSIEESLKAAKITPYLFAESQSDPELPLVEKGAEFLRGLDQKIDGIVAVGGGSAIDLGKAIATMATNPGPLASYEGPERFPNAPLPIVALPTTAGTGSEVSPSSVLTDPVQRYKFLLWSRRIIPQLAILDPTLALSAPRSVRLAAGLDALTHAVESVLSTEATVYSEPLALKGIELVGKFLPQVVLGQDSLEAMEGMLVAANLAGLAFCQTRLGVVHALALPLSARFNVPHGVAVSVLLPHGLAFNRSVAQGKYGKILAALGQEGELEEVISSWAKELGAPTTMEELGVRRDEISAMAQDAAKSGHLEVNPRHCSLSDLEAIYQAAF